MAAFGEITLKQKVFLNRTAACEKAGAGAGESVKAVAERNKYALTLIPHPTSPLH